MDLRDQSGDYESRVVECAGRRWWVQRLDPIAGSNFYASNPDVPPQGLGVQLCTSGVYCNNSAFNFVVTSSGLDGDDGAFYFPFILDPGSSTAMLVGTC